MLALAACGGGGGGGGAGGALAGSDAAPAPPLSEAGSGTLGGSGPAGEPVATDPKPGGAIYHVSATGSDSESGSQDHPWQSLARVQAAIDAGSLRAGDAVLFARGQRFFGHIELTAALRGTSAAPIVFGAFGSGAAPVLHGWRLVEGWVSVGAGRWRANCADCVATPALLRLDGRNQRIARWPNEDAADGGYRTIAASNGHDSITDPDLLGGPDWSGGELVVRSTAWVLERLPIAVHDADRIDTAADASYPLRPGWGYFIQNHPDAIDLEGEWSFDAASRTLTLQSATDPNGRRVEVPVQRDLLTVRGSSHVTLRDLGLEGSARHLIDAASCTALRLVRLELAFAGNHGALIDACPGSTVEDSIVREAMNFGLAMLNCGDCAVLRSTFSDIGLAAGMGGNGDDAYSGVALGGSDTAGARMRYSLVQHTGYLGVRLDGRTSVSESDISGFNRVKTDGAGIYTWGRTDVTISDNFVHDAGGSIAGTAWQTPATHGIYVDDNSERVAVVRNTVADVGAAAVFLHNTRDTSVTDNWLIGAGEAGILMIDDSNGSAALERSTVRGNQVVVRGVPVLQVGSTLLANLFDTLGTVDGNRYCDPFAEVQVRVALAGQPEERLGLAAWRAAHGRDKTSTACSARTSPAPGELADVLWRQTNATALPLTVTTPAQTLKGLDGSTYAPGSTLTLAPLASIVLLK